MDSAIQRLNNWDLVNSGINLYCSTKFLAKVADCKVQGRGTQRNHLNGVSCLQMQTLLLAHHLTSMLLTMSLFCFYRQIFTLNIRVTDRGNPPLSSFGQLEIEVTDENDNAPVFSLASYRATVRENTPQGTSFFKASYQMDVPFSSLTQHFALSEKLLFTLEQGMGRTGVEFS